MPTGCQRRPPQTAPPPPAVTVAYPIRQVVTDYAEHSGTIQAVETVDVRARVQGWLQSMHYTPAATVDKDVLLFTIDPSQYQAALDAAKADLAQKKAMLQFARFERQRVENIFQQGAGNIYERNQAIANEAQAAAAVQASEAALEQAQLNLGYTRVTAPIAGRVSRNLVDVGNLVGAASQPTVLANMVHDRQVYVYFSASESEHLAWVRMYGPYRPEDPASQVNPPAYLGLSDETDYPHEGRVDYADIKVDPNTGTIMIRAVFDNDAGLLTPGLFARIRVPIRTREALLISDVAVAADPGGQYVLVVGDDDVVERRPVQAGQIVGQMRVIEQGLTLTDRVVVSGIQRARPGTKVQVTEAPATGEATSCATPQALPQTELARKRGLPPSPLPLGGCTLLLGKLSTGQT